MTNQEVILMQKESNLKKLSVYFKEYKKLYIILFIALLISEAV